jgi:hypothetical protein
MLELPDELRLERLRHFEHRSQVAAWVGPIGHSAVVGGLSDVRRNVACQNYSFGTISQYARTISWRVDGKLLNGAALRRATTSECD